MITVLPTDYGFRLTFVDPITLADAEEFRRQMAEGVLALEGREFSVFADLRRCVLMPANVRNISEAVQRNCRLNGMQRSVVVVDDDVTAMQLRDIARKTGIYEYERYLVTTDDPMWERAALKWLVEAVDPDVRLMQASGGIRIK